MAIRIVWRLGTRPLRRGGADLRKASILAVCLLLLIPATSCGGKRPSSRGASGAQLAPCPSSANCVSSDASDPAHHVAPLALSASPEQFWLVLQEEVAHLPRTIVVEQTASYLHAECASAVFGFVDDLEVEHRPSADVVAIRSASRVGHSDLGVNRRRVERLREALRRRDVVE
jgi:uncharacterized protein (DUF1499 family)